MTAAPGARSALTALAVVSMALVGCGGGPEPPEAAAAAPGRWAAPAPTAPDALRRFRSTRDVVEVPPPTAVRIPGIGVSSGLEVLHRNLDGTVGVPSDWQRAGWYGEGARPGQRGPAVILGHVDSRDGPAVFFRLRELEPGDEVLVERQDGSTARFVVDRVERHPKDRFPTEAVYYPTLDPTLRLVTCGGEFDRSARHYRDNVIVFATLA